MIRSVSQRASEETVEARPSGLREHELTAEAVKLNAQLEAETAGRKAVEAELHAANERLASHTANLEQLVAHRTEKLRETVSEPEAFSYSVAHDIHIHQHLRTQGGKIAKPPWPKTPPTHWARPSRLPTSKIKEGVNPSV